MPGYLGGQLPALGVTSGAESIYLDGPTVAGQGAQCVSLSLAQLALETAYYNNTRSKTMVAGTRYYTQLNIGVPVTLTGLQALVGGTGGTDNWLVELHNAAGVSVANSALAGATAGTAGTWQQFAFTTPYAALAGTYFVVVQSNGTTATLGTLNSPINPLITGSATGTFGTVASFTPATTYTANLGPAVLAY